MDAEFDGKNLPAFKGFDSFIEKILRDWKVPGIGVAVVQGDQVIFTRGFGYRDLENQLPVDSETLFAIGSGTKSFTSMGISLLVDQGVLDWDQPVREIIPEFRLQDPFATDRLTLRDMFCHRSGLPRHDFIWYDRAFTRKEIIDRLRYLTPNSDFRTQFHYQNLMIMTAGYLIEYVTGRSWEEFTQKEIFDRLGMNRSNFSVEESQQDKNHALPYIKAEDAAKRIPFLNIDVVGPTGSINSTLDDMTRWLITQLNQGRVQDVQLVSPANLAQMHTPTMPVPRAYLPGMEEVRELGDISYGLAWFLAPYRGHRMIYHTGNNAGFSALTTFLPDDQFGVVILSNLDLTNAPFSIMFNIYDRLLGLDPLPLNEKLLTAVQQMEAAASMAQSQADQRRRTDTRPSHSLEEYGGDYEHPGYGRLKVTLADGKLHFSLDALAFDLEHYHYDIFDAVKTEGQGIRLKVSFSTDVEGNIASISVPFEPSVENIVFTRVASDEMRQASFLEQFVGKYRFMETQVIEVVLKGEKLTVAMMGAPEMELEPYQGTEFKVKGMPVSIDFKMVDGQVTGADLIQGGAVFNAEKIE